MSKVVSNSCPPQERQGALQRLPMSPLRPASDALVGLILEVTLNKFLLHNQRLFWTFLAPESDEILTFRALRNN